VHANDPTTWNYNTGVDYLLFSYAAYCPESQLQTWTCKWCHNNTNIGSFTPTAFPQDKKSDTFGFVGYSSQLKQIVVSFRGTHNLRNWIVDLKFSKLTPFENFPNVSVHDGFYSAYQRLQPQVISAVDSLQAQFPDYNIIVTGHSLGAALATLAAMDVGRRSNNTYVWHYGSPRVGNQGFSDLFRAIIPRAHYRHTNNRDIVPHLPPMSFGFYHCPQEVWEKGTAPTDFKLCDESGEDKSCSDGQLDWSVNDHLNYFGYHESCS